LTEPAEEKTAGNPFFVIQFLHTLAEEGLLAFDPDAAWWCWDLDHIHAKSYTDNVVDLMVGKLARLPAETQEAFASPQLSHEFHWGNCQCLNLCIFRFLSGELFLSMDSA
jgi:hypothetical protein